MSFTDPGEADDNVIQTFQLEESLLRGRAVRLGSVLNEILEPHNYPEPVAHLVAETMTLALLLSSMLKYDGIFTLQTKGDGPVSMLVADVTSKGEVRGCAGFDPERVRHAAEQVAALAEKDVGHNHLAQYLGKGYIAFTVDQGGNTDRYQGIVELNGASLVECVQHYFNQSEQIGTAIRMAVGKYGPSWRAGGIMLQHMPEDRKKSVTEESREDDWRRSMILLNSSTDDELLSPHLHSNGLLYRLFHEEGVRVYEPVAVTRGCRCDPDKIVTILGQMSEDDLKYMEKDGQIEVKCEFCSREFIFDLAELKAKIARKKN